MFFLEADALRKNFGGIQALKDGSMRLKKGRICGLLGANGSGKTTFSRILTGIYPCSGGCIKIEGCEIDIRNPQTAQKCGIVMVHQNLSLLNELTVWENIALNHEVRTSGGFVDKAKCMQLANEALRKLTDDIALDALIKELSPAQKQLVEIAKALSKEARLLILDEPTAALTKNEVKKLFEVMLSLKEQGISMIFISHRLWEVLTICDQIVVLRDGCTVGDIDFEYEEKDEKRIVSMITGKKDNERICDKQENKLMNEAALEIKDLCAQGNLDNINLTVLSREIIGLAGLQNQGQEQLLEVLSGLLPFERGGLTFKGKKLNVRHTRDMIRNGIVLVPGDRHKEGLFLSHSVYENMIFPHLLSKKKRIFLQRKVLQEEVQNAIERLNIVPDNQKKTVAQLSGGNQQKVVVGKWLRMKPAIWLLSDPAKGVDVQAKAELYNIMSELAKDGASILLYASDNEELLSICDRILVMFEGRIVAEVKNDCLTDEELTALVFESSRMAAQRECAK